MKYYIIAGEASGDLHASNLMKAIRLRDEAASFRCWGGDMMLAAGGELVRHYKDLAFMGFVEVALNLKTITRNLRFCKQDILWWQADVLILVDYPGFNLRIAAFAARQGFRVVYYISPQVWAWKKSRVHGIKRNIGKMITILPFEQDFYAAYDYAVDYVGHPLLDVIHPGEEQPVPGPAGAAQDPLIALLPGSRVQEIERVLPIMLSVVPLFPGCRFVVAGAPGVPASVYQRLRADLPCPLVQGKTYDILREASAALVTSGTASLEAALFRVPQVICYKGSAISFAIAKRIVHIKYIGLPNLIMDREIIKELIQNELTTKNLQLELSALLDPSGKREQVIRDYTELSRLLGGPGASDRAAVKILDYCQSTA